MCHVVSCCLGTRAPAVSTALHSSVPPPTQRIAYCKSKSDAIAKLDGSYVEKKKKKVEERKCVCVCVCV